jgi:hypothetical protein
MKVMTLEKFKEKAEKIKVDGLRDCRNMPIGKVVRQGDIYIHRVADNHKHGKEIKNHQLAMGITLGSRHIADENFTIYQGTTLPEWVDRGHFLGPCIQNTRDTSLVEHPEHANVALGKGLFQVTIQIDIRTLSRVND